MQLVELQQNIEKFRSQGVGVVGISYDSVAILADFTRRNHITFPLLSDPDSRIIRTFGILNTSIPKSDRMHYGIPNPGTYRVNTDGVVQSKYFLADFQERYSAPTILLREFGSVTGTRETVVNTNHLELEYYSTRDVLHPDIRFTLVADFDLKPRMHVYAPGVKHYMPIRIDLDRSNYFYTAPAEYPKPENLLLPAINETVPVFQGKFRVSRDVTLRERDALGTLKELKIKGNLRYQACDDKICYLPQTVPVEWDLKVDMIYGVHDRAQVDVQHGDTDLAPVSTDPPWPGGTATSEVATGPAVGQTIPAFSARDQHGKVQTFDSVRGPNGALIVFFQSADWSPYCKSQLEELQQYSEEFKKQGVALVGVSYDSVAILSDFARRKGIAFPLLSDRDSKIMKAFGIWNSGVAKKDMRYGMANPGSYRVNADGVIQSKYFLNDFRERYYASAILLREFGSIAGEQAHSTKTEYLDLNSISEDTVRPGQHLVLVADLALKPSMRIAAPGAEKYVPLSLELDPAYSYYVAKSAQYPRAENIALPGTNETIPAYAGTVRVNEEIAFRGRDTVSALPVIKIKGRLRFQPCDEKTCYPPQTIPVEWNVNMVHLDDERVPDAIQHLYAP